MTTLGPSWETVWCQGQGKAAHVEARDFLWMPAQDTRATRPKASRQHHAHRRRVDRRPGIIRARPLGESIELLSGDEDYNSADDSKKHGGGPTSPPGRTRTALRRGWSNFVAGADHFICKPHSADVEDFDIHSNTMAPAKTVPELTFRRGCIKLAKILTWDIIHPDSRFRTAWDISIILLLFYVAFVTTYTLCFEFTADSQLDAFDILDSIVNAFFMLDIWFNFRTGIRKGDDVTSRNTIITSRRRIAINYLTGGFLIDLVAALPWNEIASTSLGSYMSLLKLLRLARLLRLFTVSKNMQRNRMYQNAQARHGVAFLRVGTYVIGAIMVLHLSASAWYFTAVMENTDLIGTWVEAAGLEDANNFQKYLTSLYFVVITFTTVGYGDVVPVTTAERVMSCIGMLIGVITLGYIISTANSIMGAANKYEISKAEIRSRVEQFLSEQPLPTSMASRIKAFYDHISNRNYNNSQDDELVAGLPADLRRDVLRDMHANLIRKVPFFSLAAEAHEELVLDITAALRMEFFGKRECVVMEGGWDTELYFVTEGMLWVKQYQRNAKKGSRRAIANGDNEVGPDDGDDDTTTVAGGGGGSRLRRMTYAPPLPFTPNAAEPAATGAEQGRGQQQQLGRGRDAPPPVAGGGGGAPDGGSGGGRTQSEVARNAAAVQNWLITNAVSGYSIPGSEAGPALTAAAVATTFPATAAAPPQMPAQHTTIASALYGGAMPTAAGASALSPFAASAAQALDATSARLPQPMSQQGGGWPLAATSAPAAGGAAGLAHGSLFPPSAAALQRQQEELERALEAKRGSQPRRTWRMKYDPKDPPQRKIRCLKPGDYFGEYACLTGCPRTASVVTERMTELYSLRRADMAAAMSKWPALQAAWKECEAYGTRERERIQLVLRGGRAPLEMSLSADGEDDVWEEAEPPEQEKAVRSERRYREFVRHFMGGGGPGGRGGDGGGGGGGGPHMKGATSRRPSEPASTAAGEGGLGGGRASGPGAAGAGELGGRRASGPGAGGRPVVASGAEAAGVGAPGYGAAAAAVAAGAAAAAGGVGAGAGTMVRGDTAAGSTGAAAAGAGGAGAGGSMEAGGGGAPGGAADVAVRGEVDEGGGVGAGGTGGAATAAGGAALLDSGNVEEGGAGGG